MIHFVAMVFVRFLAIVRECQDSVLVEVRLGVLAFVDMVRSDALASIAGVRLDAAALIDEVRSDALLLDVEVVVRCLGTFALDNFQDAAVWVPVANVARTTVENADLGR